MKTKQILSSAIVLVALGLSCGPTATGSATAATVAASSRTVTAQAAYECQAEAEGAPGSRDTVSVQVQLSVPTSVAPGDIVSLRGTLKMQLSEQLRQQAQAFGYDTIDSYSTTLSTYRTMAGGASHYFADRWQSGPTPIRNPLEVSGPLTFPSFTVPDNASGEVKLQLMQNGATNNIVTSNPAKVAFTVYSRASGPGGSVDARVSCWMPRTNPAVITTIPVSEDGTNSGPDPNSVPSNDVPGPPTPPQGTTDETPAAPAPQDAGPVPDGTSTGPGGVLPPGAVEGSPSGVVAGSPQAYAPTATEPEQGVYLSTGLLVLGGFVLILVALGYAMLTNIRIRNIRRAMDN